MTDTPTPRTREEIVEGIDRYNAMGAVDRALADSDQLRSFITGQIPHDQPDREAPRDVLADEVRRLRTELAAVTAERDELLARVDARPTHWRPLPPGPGEGE